MVIRNLSHQHKPQPLAIAGFGGVRGAVERFEDEFAFGFANSTAPIADANYFNKASARQRLPEQHQHPPPCLLRLVMVVDSRIDWTPAVLRPRVHLDFRRQLRLGERFAQGVLCLRVLGVVAGGDRDEELRLHARDEQVRAVGFVGGEATIVEGRCGADAVGHVRCGDKHLWPAHAVTHGAELAPRVDGRLLVEERDERFHIDLIRVRIQCVVQRHQGFARCRIVEVGVLGRRGRRLRPVEGIDHQHRVTGLREARGHVLERGAQAEDIRPDQHARVLARCRVDEVGVGGAGGRLDGDVLAFGFDGGGSSEARECGDEACGERHLAEGASR